MRRPSKLKAPFLRGLRLIPDSVEDWEEHPFNLPFLAGRELDLAFEKRVTIIAGPNGAGKSTLIEAIAAQCGFSAFGGNRNHTGGTDADSALAKHLRLSWLPKVTRGFFIRAESLFAFIAQIDALAAEPGGRIIYDAYGGQSLSERSHGESFSALFRSRLSGEGIFLLDEPEAALSPMRQIDFLKLIANLDRSECAQLVIVTHSPLIMAYPNADLFHVDHRGIIRTFFKQMENFRVLREFYTDPDLFLYTVLGDEI